MSGAIDLYSGTQSIHGANLFIVDKSPLQELSGGVQDIIGKQATSTGDSFITGIEQLLRALLGFDPLEHFLEVGGEVLGNLFNLSQYFGNLEDFLGELNPLDPDFDPIAAITTFINGMLGPTGLLAMLTDGLLDLLNIPGLDASKIISGQFAIEMIEGLEELLGGVPILGDLIEAITGIEDGDYTDIGTYFINLETVLGDFNLSDPDFDFLAWSQNFVSKLLGPLALLLNPLLGIEENPNLLSNGAFQDAISVAPGAGWAWDGTDGHTAVGCAVATATGTTVALRSNPIAVTEGQNLNLSVWVKWSGVTATGEAIKLDLVTFLDDLEIGVETIDSITDPVGNQATWIELADIWAAPAGVNRVRLRLAVENTAAGSIKFDDGVVRKTTLLQQQANDAADNIQETWDRLVNSWSGITGTGRSIDNLNDAVLGSVEAQTALVARMAQWTASQGSGTPDSDAFERAGAL